MKVIDLRPDPKLLAPRFDAYKLSLEPIAILRVENIKKVFKVSPNLSSEYSFLHSMLYSMQNHLIPDPWLSNSAYYIDESLAVNKIFYDSTAGKLNKTLTSVFKYKNGKTQNESGGIYNAEIKFVSEKYALISDGTGSLLLIDTGDRQRSDEWKQIDSLKPLDDGKGFIIQDAKFTIDNGEKVIHCLLLHVEQSEDKFYNFVDWITFKEESGTKKWSSIARRTIKGKGILYYLSLDIHCTSIVYSSNHQYKFIYDDVNEIVAEEAKEDEASNEIQSDESVNTFQWSQNEEDIVVNFNPIPSSTKEMYKIKCLQSHIEVKCNDEILVDSDLFAEIDVDLTTWTIENESLQLNLIKKCPELIWPYLTPSGPSENPSNDKNMKLLASQPVTDLNSQMEECDFGDDGNDSEEYLIEQLDATTHKVIHKVFLGSNHPLFSKTLRPGFPKAIAIRNDVDCCLWLQHQITVSDNEWELKHEG